MLLLMIYVIFSMDLPSSLFSLFFLQMIMYSIFFSSVWYHLIILLMILEMFMLLIFLMMNVFFLINKLSMFFVFLFITLSVSEASIGLSLLTMLVRGHGNDYMKISIF